MEQPILNGLMAYNTRGYYPWHMPGHKRKLYTIFPEWVENPFSIDVTEVEDLDEFHHPQGIIREAFDRAAQIYGSQKSYYLVNGASCGILAAIAAVCRQGDSLIMARNCHKSVYHAVRLLRLKPIYIMPEWNAEYEMFGGVSVDTVKRVLKGHPEAKAVLLVSPTYEGVVSDIEKIARLVHKAKLPLIVDEAHGAHFEFMANTDETISATDYNRIPAAALRLGADIVIESLHKTLPAMTQCAVLHLNTNLVSPERIEEFLSVFQSTSPSYVFMAAMEACIEKMDYERDGLFIVYKTVLAEYRKRFGQLKHIHLMEEADFKRYKAAGYDDGKLVFSVKNCGIRQGEEVIPFDGVMLGDMLAEEYGQMVEMRGGSYIIAMTSVADTKEAFEALYQAIETIDRQLMDWTDNADTIIYKRLPERKMGIAEAQDNRQVQIPLSEAAGKISGEYIYVYPPGIPMAVPGEVLSKEVLKEIRLAQDKRLNLKGLQKKEASGKEEFYLSVVRENRWRPRYKKKW
ncbi:MAG: aminotransferase class I/II-fold pyridoxal phosphate-dependent enzyme [Bacteroidales bacterium]|nr:aminotransferase class I/II-fold pyridoxal phosphate-dependent enzyme [Clostridium sp.]MCM1204455.1 aminotransferase class I/II-fold pyridoxal phosphate-dependent enzyme [Bacteroidales bacterium]